MSLHEMATYDIKCVKCSEETIVTAKDQPNFCALCGSKEIVIKGTLGGLGSNSDIHQAWKKFCMANHPDKGGDPQKFLEVKVCYDEWCAINNK